MAYLTANGLDVFDARISIPRLGVWHADVAVDSLEPISGAVTLDLNGVSLRGTVRRGGVLADTGLARIVGGAGGFNRVSPARAYRAIPLSVPLADVLGAAKETLSPLSDSGALSTTLPLWVSRETLSGLALLSLLEGVNGLTWRVLADGKTWLGFESWKPSALSDFDLLREDPLAGRIKLYAERPNVFPGETLNGRRVSYVEHVVRQDSIRTEVWTE